MDWGQYIKRTAVRRVVWIVVGLILYAVLGWFSDAHAQVADGCVLSGGSPWSAVCETREHAYAWAMQAGPPAGEATWGCSTSQRSLGPPHHVLVNADYGSSGSYNVISLCNGRQGNSAALIHWTQGCPAGTVWREDLKECAGPCAGLLPREFNRNTSIWGAPPAQACVSGCAYSQDASSTLCTLVEEGPTSGYWCHMIYQPTGGTCEAGEEIPPPDPDAPDAACSADEVRLPNGQCSPRGQCPIGQHEVNGECHPSGSCPVGHVKAPDGSCVPESCPAGQARGADGTCKADSNEDGTPDEDEEGGEGTNTDGMQFSGGESCAVPPTCSGDPIMCGQARIQWRIDCNTRRAESVVGGNACDTSNMPICVGEACDPVEQKQLILQWQSMCALQDLVGQDEDGEGDAGGDLGGIKDGIDRIGDFLDGNGDCMATEEGCGEGGDDHWIDGDDVEASEWSSGLPSTGSCPAPISRTISLGQHVQDIEFSYQPLCDFAALLRWVLITAATILSALLIGGFRSNS